MFKTVSRLTLIVCVLSISIFSNVSFAYLVDNTEKNQLNIRYQDVEDKERALEAVRTVLGDLNSDWDDAIANMTSNQEIALITGVGAVISSLVAAASGGSLAPAAYTGFVSKYKSEKAKTYQITSADYLTSMSASLSQLDAALAAIETAYTLYAQQHDRYVGVMATHIGRTKDALSIASSNGQTLFSHTGNTSGDPHSVDPLWGKDHWDMDDLPNEYACKSGNPCMYSYRTPYKAMTAHQWTCGSDYHIVSHRVPGCGEKYYKCPNYEIPVYHNTFTCTRYNLVITSGEQVRDYCGTNFRYCTIFTYDHYGNITTITSAGRCAKLLGVGQSGSHNHSNSDDTDTSPGAHQHSEVTATTITYACNNHSGVASAASGHVAAGCGNPTHFICDLSDHASASCGLLDHFNCDNKDHTVASCGGASHYVCDGLTHQEVQCSSTSGSDQCTYTYWDCLNDGTPSHNHTYPEPTLVECRRYNKGCGGMAASEYAHRSTCPVGHNYWWGCADLSDTWYHNHTTHTQTNCTRCGVPFYPCQRLMECTNGKGHRP